jgi:hypothetical protein
VGECVVGSPQHIVISELDFALFMVVFVFLFGITRINDQWDKWVAQKTFSFFKKAQPPDRRIRLQRILSPEPSYSRKAKRVKSPSTNGFQTRISDRISPLQHAQHATVHEHQPQPENRTYRRWR